MPTATLNRNTSRVTVTYSVDLTPRSNIATSQFTVMNTGIPTTVIVVSAAIDNNNTLILELGGGVIPETIFGIRYLPGQASDRLITTDNRALGEIYYTIDGRTTPGVCLGGDCAENPARREEPLQIISATCASPETLVLTFNQRLSSNFIPAIASFSFITNENNTFHTVTDILMEDIAVLNKTVTLNFSILDTAPEISSLNLQYLPPATDYLRTSANPPIMVLPFIVDVVCTDYANISCLVNEKIHKNGVGTAYGTRIGEFATIEDYILIYGRTEAIQATNDDNGSAVTVNNARLQAELDHAGVLLQNYIDVANWSGKALLAGSFKRTQLVIARYYLLNKSRPEAVKEEFERTLTWVESTAYSNDNKQNPDCNNGLYNGSNSSGAAIASTGRVLNYMGAKQYDVEDGTGLRGFYLNPDEDNLWRVEHGYHASEGIKKRHLK